ncbi:MAG: hypothetical protein K0R57_6406 [Paenibacillaceae bacterium]|nr:hypothetical protein [Paenibacillaceae bacterium]
MDFHTAYEDFLFKHLHNRTEEETTRLKEGLGHAEKLFLEQVWWPVMGHFDGLVPEYEVSDFKDGSRYLDFAFLRPPYRICIEIDGYGPHLRDLSRWQHADQLHRQNDLVMDGWLIFRFAYTEVKEKPRSCQQMIQRIMGRWYGSQLQLPQFKLKESEIIRHLVQRGSEITSAEVMQRLKVSDRSARDLLHSLAAQKIILPVSGKQRVRRYKLNPQTELPALW